MPGYEALRSAQHLARILRILRGNAADLQDYFDRLNHPTNPVPLLELWSEDNRDAFDGHLDEAERLLFNLLASCQARVDFYRTLVNRDLIDGELKSEYDRRVGTLSSTPLHRWLIALRNLMLHHDLPVLDGSLAMGSGVSVRTGFRIDLASLLRSHSDDFTGPARQYMIGRDEQDVLEAIAEYLELIGGFDDWFGPAYAGHHLEDIEAFLKARSAAGQAMWNGMVRRERRPRADQ